MAEKYQNEAHQKPDGKMTIEDTEIFLSKDYLLRLACLKQCTILPVQTLLTKVVTVN